MTERSKYRGQASDLHERGPEAIDVPPSGIDLAYRTAVILGRAGRYPVGFVGEGALIPQTDGKITNWDSLED